MSLSFFVGGICVCRSILVLLWSLLLLGSGANGKRNTGKGDGMGTGNKKHERVTEHGNTTRETGNVLMMLLVVVLMAASSLVITHHWISAMILIPGVGDLYPLHLLINMLLIWHFGWAFLQLM